MDDPKAPARSYKKFGNRLKELRVRTNETLAEASGAVEIDVKELANYELGQARPSADILLLLISHFSAKDDEALELWELAGYSTDKIPSARLNNFEITAIEPATEIDTKILFTDIVDVVVNNYGVVMNFMQNSGKGQPALVARVGMSREHAKSVLKILQITLNQTEKKPAKLPRRLITPDNSNQEQQK